MFLKEVYFYKGDENIELNKKRYRDLDTYFKKKFNKKIIKLPLDGGFSCPNRDGTISTEGCIFCSDSGSGEWTYGKMSIKMQIECQKKRLAKPGRDEAYIGYFQNFTNTYGPVRKLRALYEAALEDEDLVGLFIATRGDSLSDGVVDLLKEISEKTFLVVELGMQTVNDKTLRLINRGYSHEVFDEGIRKLKDSSIRTLIHLIVGLPYENDLDYKDSIAYINSIRPRGIKVHNLYVEKDSRLYNFYKDNDLAYSMDLETYVDIVVKMLINLDPAIVINRLTGDGIRGNIIFPTWAKNKGKILTTIDKNLKKKT